MSVAALVLTAAAPVCTAAQIQELTAPSALPYRLTCRADLGGRAVRRPILIQGAAASGAGVDCGGGRIVAPGPADARAPTVAVWSHREGARWSRPTDVYVRRCTVVGNVRIWGMGAGGSMRDLLASSRTAGHTAAAQAAAPQNVRLDQVRFEGQGTIPLYIGPGATRVTVTDAVFTGRSTSVAVYLDAESAGNVITGGRFDIRTGREVIAVDGSGANRIVGNRFALGGRGGVFLYRNCGEDGVIRHQTPSYNHITDNIFAGAGRLRPRTVVVNARNGARPYCRADQGWPFGSSRDDRDGGTGNVVLRNRTVR